MTPSYVARRIGFYVLICAITLFFAVPMLWIASAPFDKNPGLGVQWPDWTFENVRKTLDHPYALHAIENSLIICVTVAVAVTAFAAFASYALSRVRIPGRDALLYGLLLLSSVVTGTAAMVPIFVMIYQLGLILRDVVLPVARPGLATIMVWAFVNSWGNFLVPFLLIRSTTLQPAAVLMQTLTDEGGSVNLQVLSVFSLLFSIPVVVLYLLVNSRYGKRGVAMVFQDYALFPHMSVAENITYPLKVRRVAAATRAETAERTAGELSLGGLLERRPGQLSGGQQQRVALARAIASQGKVLLLDEPLSNLDARLRLEARTFLKNLQRNLGITTVFVTHDQAEALALADRIAVMESGKLRQLGTPREVFARPVNTFVANFIGSTPMNLIPGVVAAPATGSGPAGRHHSSVRDGVGVVSVAGGTLPAATNSVPAGAEVTVGIRPEYLTLSTGDATSLGIHGTVVVAENLGVQSLVSVDCGGTLIGMTVPEEEEPEPGKPVFLTAPAARVLLYDRESGELLARQPVA